MLMLVQKTTLIFKVQSMLKLLSNVRKWFSFFSLALG